MSPITMAESHEMLLDVKLDLKDVKNDNCLKNWVNWMKCHVKIDAIECFPCYLKVSFYHEDDTNREYPFSIIRLNIPGVRVGSAASRTKSFAYGIFWKNNRKRCRLFLAFQDKQSCSLHMKWLKRSIDSLEFYRKDILENHRVSRSIVNMVKTAAADDDQSQLDISKSSLNDTLTERDMNDILGPLPEIPTANGDGCNRLSTRRSSGCSGIYEEILDPADSNFKKEQDSRGSIVSGIYVDMTAPLKLNASVELPPPLPPRRRHLNHVYTTIDMQAIENSGKSRKSTWNLKNVFGRTKGAADASKNTKINEVVKSQTSSAISNLCANDCQLNLLTKCKNSFSTPDLTNICTCSPITTATTNVKNELDETDLDVMDIERSNSLNCATNQFACRPPPLNISDNILWSHNLSQTLSSTANTSAINLVGANVNGRDSILGRDISGYCKMAPILNQNNRHQMVRTSTKNYDEPSSTQPTESPDCSAIYCVMAPILPKANIPLQPNQIEQNLMKNITFERTFDFDEDRSSILDCSMKSVEHSNHASLSDITSSSGVGSYDGNNLGCVTPINLTTTTTASATSDDRRDSDDAISLTYTESPPQSAQAGQYSNENPFIYHSSKFDEKTPSYFPNKTSLAVQDSTKYVVDVKSPKSLAKNGRKSTDPVAIPVMNKDNFGHNSINGSTNHPKTPKKQIYKGVLKTPSSGKVQKLKQRRSSIPENNVHFEQHPTAITYKNENVYIENTSRRIYQSSSNEYFKYETLPHSFDSKKVLSHLDPNTKYDANRHLSNFEKNSKSIKIKASPRRIYNKCATLARSLKTPPSTPTEITSTDQLNTSIDTVMQTAKEFHNGNGLIRSWTRFRKIDFSPLKTKINSIWQRPNQEY